jgi:uncharacterized DUF497 family protein
MPPECEWDEAKNRENIARHGIDFGNAPRILEQPILVRLDDREDYGEDRWIALGRLDDVIVVMVFADREDRVRVISIRKASRHERQIYEENLGGTQ